MIDSVLLGIDDTSLAQIFGEMFCHSSRLIIFSCSLLQGFCCSACCFWYYCHVGKFLSFHIFSRLGVSFHSVIGYKFTFMMISINVFSCLTCSFCEQWFPTCTKCSIRDCNLLFIVLYF